MPTSPRATSTRRRRDLPLFLLRRTTTTRSMRRRRRWLEARTSERYKDSRRNTIRHSRSSSSSRNHSNNSSRSRSRSNSQWLLRPGPLLQVRSFSLKLSLQGCARPRSMIQWPLTLLSHSGITPNYQVPTQWSRAPLPGSAVPCSAGCSPTRWAVGGHRLSWSRLRFVSCPELL